MRADRLLSILFLLQAHGRLSARELAARLEVSDRTIARDMEALSIAGVPVYAERGRSGGWQLTEDYRTDLTGLTEPELRSLVMATMPGVLADLGLGEAADRAVAKLLSALPDARRREAEAARSYLHVDPGGWRRTEEVATALPLLDEALRRGRRIRMQYERMFDGGGPSERTVDPLGLVAKGSVWYLVAGIEAQVRTYRASRIHDVEILDDAAARPDGFDLAEFWGRSRQEFEQKLPSFLAVVRLAPAAHSRVRAGWWRYARILEESEPDANGWTTCTLRTDGLEVARDVVLGLGSEARVVDPPELRTAVLAAARAAIDGAGGNDS
jgi:predicted DNA-binding transcriptional regulator YafY